MMQMSLENDADELRSERRQQLWPEYGDGLLKFEHAP